MYRKNILSKITWAQAIQTFKQHVHGLLFSKFIFIGLFQNAQYGYFSLDKKPLVG